jgi:hypothetical protein
MRCADAFNAGQNGALGPNMISDIQNGDFVAAGDQFNAWYGKIQLRVRRLLFRAWSRVSSKNKRFL